MSILHPSMILCPSNFKKEEIRCCHACSHFHPLKLKATFFPLLVLSIHVVGERGSEKNVIVFPLLAEFYSVSLEYWTTMLG